ncbi:hypothetical protein [Chenggangzhangella methanolivorans]|uniref:Uncharacterized protein n=1 Tax=Chenggangzhangella methanolivorans TaxID=1437009 RepID=A0A9E6UP82_9HYPH|nr:hypothetical protein [Chenggangzhangella methanolivorans]QZN99449.1 hypothetical protein K6K41_22390 [Chenggangzhangella methanolivorans]
MSFMIAPAVADDEPATAPAVGCVTQTGQASGALRLIVGPEDACAPQEMRIELAASGLRWLGDWKVDRSYKVGDTVFYKGSSFIAVEKSKGAAVELREVGPPRREGRRRFQGPERCQGRAGLGRRSRSRRTPGSGGTSRARRPSRGLREPTDGGQRARRARSVLKARPARTS